MKGYWHLPALAVLMSILTVTLHTHIAFIGFLCWLCYLYYKGRLKRVPLLLSLSFYFIFISLIPQILVPQEDSALLNIQQIKGTITSPPVLTNTYFNFVLQENNDKEKITVFYFINDDTLDVDDVSRITYGAQCNINGSIQMPSKSRNPGQFDYQRFLLSKGISYELIVDSLHDIECNGSKIMSNIYSIRNNLINYTSNLLSEDTASWLNALVLGDDSMLETETIELFQRWSLSHILAISGLHVGLIIALLYFLLVKSNVVTKETAQWIVVFFLPFYAIIAGGAPSVLRASLMGLLFIILSKFKVKYSVTDVLSVIFICLIIFDPYIVYNIGFQLSFLVTFGLILSQKWLFAIRSPFWQILRISFIAQMMIVPLQISYFSTFQPLSIILNSIIVPYFSLFVIPSMFLLLLFSPMFPKFAIIFDNIFSLIQNIVLQITYFIDNLLYFPWVIGELPLITFIVYYGLLILVMNYLEKNQLWKGFRVSLLIVLLLFLIVIRPYFSPEGIVTTLDIGQGDAYVIELPYRKSVILVDAGASFSFNDFQASPKIFEQIIRPYLHSRGITEIDAIFISHEDLDHNGSIPYLIEKMRVKQLIISEYYQVNEQEKEIILKNKVGVQRVKEGEDVKIGGHLFRVLSPYRDLNDANDNSLVLKTELAGMKWLFTGDISKSIERQLIQENHQLKADILKVAHHGSNTSTDPYFINTIEPKYAIISVGMNNRYGHPTENVISTLKEGDVTILRTDIHGAIQFRFRKNGGTFYTFFP